MNTTKRFIKKRQILNTNDQNKINFWCMKCSFEQEYRVLFVGLCGYIFNEKTRGPQNEQMCEMKFYLYFFFEKKD